MKIKISTLILVVFTMINVNAQEELVQNVFDHQSINFGGEKGIDKEVTSLQSGRLIYKKVTVPKFKKGTDVTIKLTLRSNGDRWDKSGSCFVITDPEQISILNVSKGEKEFPLKSTMEEKFRGVLATENYKPAVEILRFMTPFGVGHYSDDGKKYRKPVYIPTWEKQVVWEHDISDLTTVVSGTFYVGIWIDTWTKEGYNVDLSFTYSNRPKKAIKVIPLVNTVPYGATYNGLIAISIYFHVHLSARLKTLRLRIPIHHRFGRNFPLP